MQSILDKSTCLEFSGSQTTCRESSTQLDTTETTVPYSVKWLLFCH